MSKYQINTNNLNGKNWFEEFIRDLNNDNWNKYVNADWQKVVWPKAIDHKNDPCQASSKSSTGTIDIKDVDKNHTITNEKACDTTLKNDPVNHPAHYTFGKYEVADVIYDWNLNFFLGNAVKYIARAGKKDKTKTVEDLEKAVWYLNAEIKKLSEEAVG